MNLFRSIWGLMLGILLLGVNRPRQAGLTSSVVEYVKAHEGRGGLKAHNRFKACSHKPVSVCNLYCKLGIVETEPDTPMSRCRDSVNRRASHMYIRGRPGGGSRTTDNNSRLRRSLFAP